MTKLHLKKRKRFFKQIVLISILVPLVLLAFSLLRFLAFKFFNYDLFSDLLITVAVAVVLVTTGYKPVDFAVLWLVRHVFFRSHVNGQIALSHLAHEAVTILNKYELANLIVNTIADVYCLQSASILLVEREKKVYRIVSAYGVKPSSWKHVEFPEQHPLIELLRTRKLPIDQSQIQKIFSWQDANKLNHTFEQLYASYIIPLMFGDELIGSINLMTTGRSKLHSSQEMRCFFDFSREVSKAFRNAIIMTDISDANQQLMRLQTELLHTAQRSAIERLATGLAHEIHNPLTIISGKAQILLLKRDQKAYDTQVEDVLKTIVKQTKRAADITRKLLMFSESQQSVKSLLDLEEIINDTIALLSYQVSLDRIQVLKRIESPIPKFYGNIGELREAFLNLFLNAVQAIGQEGSIQVGLRYRERERLIELSIRDSGPGILKENLNKVFHPFFTTREESTGLGLFVTQQIIHGYKGKIIVQSEEGKGTSFTVELPVRHEKKSYEGNVVKKDMPGPVKATR
ncbi:MAG: hypothetical protein A3G33_11635 [Omnitrophica bacterium RIFCSPLOWO2_12_FULL_44_17]|uniref:histidine kinase n=1 Tax=Candidatus Danuiimicrobium aquiferis TaxID=1801832 RepID=A0A1G1KRQ6_9BACT|nr:MAG: hypothetical protein A3B72_09475 [Omnitrophica bacterium RIFCSPHIGHO2_02_FULL_45_28]OGW95640.1 MAG: hypothetical protein A3G33_11635 [Omnitrophica bacterium RIFCSPLOWO2_12_FULL_44_17]